METIFEAAFLALERKKWAKTSSSIHKIDSPSRSFKCQAVKCKFSVWETYLNLRTLIIMLLLFPTLNFFIDLIANLGKIKF